MSILEILQIERYIPKSGTRYRWPGRNPLDRKAMARAFVAKALYRYPTTSDLIRALQSAENLRRICGFVASGDIPSESTFSRAFAEFAASGLGSRVHDALVEEYLSEEFVGHISRDSTAITPTTQLDQCWLRPFFLPGVINRPGDSGPVSTPQAQ